MTLSFRYETKQDEETQSQKHFVKPQRGALSANDRSAPAHIVRDSSLKLQYNLDMLQICHRRS